MILSISPTCLRVSLGLFEFNHLVGTAAAPSAATYTLPVPGDAVTGDTPRQL